MMAFGRGLQIGLSAMSAGLCLVIALEVSAWRRDASSAGTARPAVAKLPGREAAPAGLDQHEAWLNQILARPLFNPDRHPVGGGAGAQGLPRLTGIIVAGSQRVAIFAAPANGHPIIAQAGGRIGAYEVQTVADEGVTVVGPEGTSMVRPAFDSTRPVAAAARPGVPQPIFPPAKAATATRP
jgi:general secretion pathway protein N